MQIEIIIIWHMKMYNGYIQILHKTLSFSFYFPPEEIHKVVAAIFLLSE